MAKQQSLWEDKKVNDNAFVLNMVESKEVKKCMRYLKEEVDNSCMEALVKLMVKALEDKEVVLKSPDGGEVENSIFQQFLAPKKKVKLTVEKNREFAATILLDSENLRKVMQLIPPQIMKVIRNLLSSWYIQADELYNTVEGKIILHKSRSWFGTNYSMNYPFFELSTAYVNSYENKFFISINRFFFGFLYKALVEEEEEMLPEDFNPKREGLKVMYTEKSMLKAYPLLFSLYNQEILKVGKTSKMLIPTIRKCAGVVQLPEFFPDSDDSFLNKIRASFVLPFFYFLFESSCKKNISTLDVLLKDYAEGMIMNEFVFPLLIPHLKGFHYYDIDDFNLDHIVDSIWQVLGDSSYRGRWIAVDQVMHCIQADRDGFESLHLLSIDDFYYRNLRLKNNRKGGESISLHNIYKELSLPCVKGILMALASLGLLDIAYRDYKEEDDSWMDWVEMVRVTKLGEYVFGISDQYVDESLQQDRRQKFDIDRDRLIVRMIEEDSSSEYFLKDVATSIGQHRYVFSYEKFMGKCATVAEVEKKIDFFKQFIAKDLSPVWEEFFSNMLVRCRPLEKISSKTYQIYKVSGQDKELQHLLSTDKVLKGCMLRAEGYLILVENKHKDLFINRIRELGYML